MSRFISKCMQYGDRFNHFVRLENHSIPYPFEPFPNIIAFDAVEIIEQIVSERAFQNLKEVFNQKNDWMFGFFSYDLKNDTENLSSLNVDFKKFPELSFFIPNTVIEIKPSGILISSFLKPENVFKAIQNQDLNTTPHQKINVEFVADTEKAHYLNTVENLRDHIYKGDVYEINYCIEYNSRVDNFDPLYYLDQLWQNSPTPFASYYKTNDKYLICSSPERFIRKQENELLSQPIKGTIQTGNSPEENQMKKDLLFNSEKERAENMMIVDLVRNDLAKSAIPGTVKVAELFGIYEFRHLFHMISSVTATISKDIHPIDVIKNAFPMGSMTGAPKIKVMELIEKYETSKRGIFSGSIGYLRPNGDFDFNVIIRSLFYNKAESTLSYSIGSAITYDSDPLYEYNECQLKAKAILEVFNK